MAQNKVQYQRGLSMPEFFNGYGSAEQCEALVRGWRWPEGFNCPRCQGGWHSEFRREGRLYFQCAGCRYQCSLVSGTVFDLANLKLSLTLRANGGGTGIPLTRLERCLASRALHTDSHENRLSRKCGHVRRVESYLALTAVNSVKSTPMLLTANAKYKAQKNVLVCDS